MLLGVPALRVDIAIGLGGVVVEQTQSLRARGMGKLAHLADARVPLANLGRIVVV